MSTTLPLERAHSVAAHEIPPGTFFCTFASPAGKRGFFLRVQHANDKNGSVSVINLTGEKPYSFESWNGETAQQRSMALPSSHLQLRLDMDATPASDEAFAPGNLMITDQRPLMIVDDGHGKPACVDIAKGELITDQVKPCACFSSWKLLSRADNGTDTVVMQIGSAE
jgi:hypothetical protein